MRLPCLGSRLLSWRRRGDPAHRVPGRAPAFRPGVGYGSAAECRRSRRLNAARARSSASREVVGQRRLEAQLLARERMPEAELGAVQELAREPVAPRVPVARIARDRMADRGEVGADLVRAAGLQARLDQGVGRQQLEHLEVGARLARRAAADRPALGGAVVAPQRGVDRPRSRARMALDQRQVVAPHLARLDLRASRRWASSVRATTISPEVSLSRRWTIPGRSGPRRRPAGLPARRPAWGRVPGRRMDDQAGGLVDHRQPVVAVDDARLEAHA